MRHVFNLILLLACVSCPLAAQDASELRAEIEALTASEHSLEKELAALRDKKAALQRKLLLLEGGDGVFRFEEPLTTRVHGCQMKGEVQGGNTILNLEPSLEVNLLGIVDPMSHTSSLDVWLVQSGETSGYVLSDCLDLDPIRDQVRSVRPAANEWWKALRAEEEKRKQQEAVARRDAERKRAAQEAEAARRKAKEERAQRLRAKYQGDVLERVIAKKVWLGMSRDMARDSWGPPKDVNRTVSAQGVREQWVYDLGRYLYFTNGLLTAWQD